MRQAALRLAMQFPECSAMQSVIGETRNWLGKNKDANRPLPFVLRGVDSSHPYLTARGILLQTAVLFGAGFYGGPGLMSGRVVIPIHDALGTLVAYAGRVIDDAVPKYRLPSGFLKSQLLFNFHRAAAVNTFAVVVVEGFFDCVKVHQAGVRSVVALMGTALSDQGQQLLLQRFRQVTLMLDGDTAGRHGTEVIAGRLAGRCAVRVVAVPASKQPDQLDSDEIRGLLGEDLKQVR